MENSSPNYDPRNMNRYLAAGSRARSDAFHALYISIKNSVTNLFAHRPHQVPHTASPEGSC